MGRRKQIEKDVEEAGNYKLREKEGYFKVEKKPGVHGSRIKNDRAFSATRAHSAEFKDCAIAGKLLRDTLSPLLKDIKNAPVTRRVTQLMTQIKNLDELPSGYKTVAAAIHTPAAKTLLDGFDFNEKAFLRNLLPGFTTTLKDNGTLTITGLEMIKPPAGTTQVIFKSAVACLDLAAKQGRLIEGKTLAVKFPLIKNTYSLELPVVDNYDGLQLYVLQVRFMSRFKMHVNGGKDNGLGVVSVF